MDSRKFRNANFGFEISQAGLSNSQSRISKLRLSFRKLETLPGTLLSVLLAFLDSGITCDKPRVF
jgi:hypothetical protein